MACLAAVFVLAATELLSWSNGLAFAALVVVETLVSLIALRESLFVPATRADGRRHPLDQPRLGRIWRSLLTRSSIGGWVEKRPAMPLLAKGLTM